MIGTNYEHAKKLYIKNFANYMTMKRNGEYKEYASFSVPIELERKWSEQVKDHLIDEICSGSNVLQVVQLARVNLPENEILEAFRVVASSSLRDSAIANIVQLKTLFDPAIFNKIVCLFQ